MYVYSHARRLSLLALAFCLAAGFSMPAWASGVEEVDKDSPLAHQFKVKALKLPDAVRISITVPDKMDGHDIRQLNITIDTAEHTYSNGTQLTILVDLDEYEKAIAHIRYFHPDSPPGGAGRTKRFKLDLSSLAGPVQ